VLISIYLETLSALIV